MFFLYFICFCEKSLLNDVQLTLLTKSILTLFAMTTTALKVVIYKGQTLFIHSIYCLLLFLSKLTQHSCHKLIYEKLKKVIYTRIIFIYSIYALLTPCYIFSTNILCFVYLHTFDLLIQLDKNSSCITCLHVFSLFETTSLIFYLHLFIFF